MPLELAPFLIRTLLGFVLGMALGMVARHGRFCTLGAIEDAVYSGDTRRARLRLETIPDDARLSSVEEGIAVQSQVERRLGLSVGGWKVGIPPGAPTYRAPIYAPHVVASPASWPGPGEGTGPTDPVIMIEGEIAFTLGRDLPPRDTPYGEAEVVAAVASAHAAIEIVQWRVPGGSEGPVAERLRVGMRRLVLTVDRDAEAVMRARRGAAAPPGRRRARRRHSCLPCAAGSGPIAATGPRSARRSTCRGARRPLPRP